MEGTAYQDFARWIASGGLHLNAWQMLASPGSAEVLARTGFDSVTIDVQHGQSGVSEMITAIGAIALAGKPAFVRIPVGDTSLAARALDAGAQGIICPMIQSAGEARALVEATRFPPLGRRSWGPHRALALSRLSAAEFLHHDNRHNCIFAMIETTGALASLEEILSTEGIDGAYVGPNDLCVSLTGGREIRVGHPAVEQAMRDVAGAARRHGKRAGVYANSPDLAPGYRRLGFDLISVGSDIEFLRTQAEIALACARQC